MIKLLITTIIINIFLNIFLLEALWGCIYFFKKKFLDKVKPGHNYNYKNDVLYKAIIFVSKSYVILLIICILLYFIQPYYKDTFSFIYNFIPVDKNYFIIDILFIDFTADISLNTLKFKTITIFYLSAFLTYSLYSVVVMSLFFSMYFNNPYYEWLELYDKYYKLIRRFRFTLLIPCLIFKEFYWLIANIYKICNLISLDEYNNIMGNDDHSYFIIHGLNMYILFLVSFLIEFYFIEVYVNMNTYFDVIDIYRKQGLLNYLKKLSRRISFKLRFTYNPIRIVKKKKTKIVNKITNKWQSLNIFINNRVILASIYLYLMGRFFVLFIKAIYTYDILFFSLSYDLVLYLLILLVLIYLSFMFVFSVLLLLSLFSERRVLYIKKLIRNHYYLINSLIPKSTLNFILILLTLLYFNYCINMFYVIFEKRSYMWLSISSETAIDISFDFASPFIHAFSILYSTYVFIFILLFFIRFFKENNFFFFTTYCNNIFLLFRNNFENDVIKCALKLLLLLYSLFYIQIINIPDDVLTCVTIKVSYRLKINVYSIPIIYLVNSLIIMYYIFIIIFFILFLLNFYNKYNFFFFKNKITGHFKRLNSLIKYNVLLSFIILIFIFYFYVSMPTLLLYSTKSVIIYLTKNNDYYILLYTKPFFFIVDFINILLYIYISIYALLLIINFFITGRFYIFINFIYNGFRWLNNLIYKHVFISFIILLILSFFSYQILYMNIYSEDTVFFKLSASNLCYFIVNVLLGYRFIFKLIDWFLKITIFLWLWWLILLIKKYRFTNK